MTVLFLVPLAIALISVYIYENSAEEMSYLTAITAIVSLFVTLAIAPWQVQILLLLVALLSSQWLLSQYQRRNQAQEQTLASPGKTVETATETPAKLIYRGQSYDYSPDKVTGTNVETQISQPAKLIYRGQTYDYSPAKVTEVAGKINIKYTSVSPNVEPVTEVPATEKTEAPKKFRFNYRGANLAKKS